MIGSDHNQTTRIGRQNGSELRLELAVHVGNLSEVLVVAVFSTERLGRVVGSVRVVQMNPHESLSFFVRAPPPRGRIEHSSGWTLLLDEVYGGRPFPIVVVVLIEPLIETEAPIERE